MAGNSLQAMLDRVKITTQEETVSTASKPRGKAIAARPVGHQATPVNAPSGRTELKPSRVDTKLIGGHFAPAYSTQLRIIAAEENTTIQNLLTEALNDLFVKKGKARIAGV